MSTHFGRHVAGEVLTQARAFLDHANDAGIWASLSNPLTGRMTAADLAEGETDYAAAQAAGAASAEHAGDTLAPTHVLDTAESAASGWLANQLAHARGLFHKNKDQVSEDALNAALTGGGAHATLAANIRAYANLVESTAPIGPALQATYPNAATQATILANGRQLAAAVDADATKPLAARGDRQTVTGGKDAAVDTLARWLHRWSLVAHNVVGHDALTTLGLGTARHHPAHRPVAAPVPAPVVPAKPV